MSAGAQTVRPASVAELAETVARAHRDRRRLLPRGSGTTPLPFGDRGADLVVDLTGLDRVVEHSPEDLVASIECGIAFEECARRLAERGQRIPLDPPATPRGTLGGLLARNAWGPLRLRHGTARDWLIGSTLVRFDGRVVKAGGMVVKNVSGYDLSKLYVGAWGSLGILARANFKLAPLPEAEAALEIRATRDAAARIVDRARGEHLPLAGAVFDGDRLTAGLEGLPGVVDRQRERLASIARDEHGTILEPADEKPRPRDELRVRLAYPAHDLGLVWEAIEETLLRRRAERPREVSLPGCGVSWLSWERRPDEWPALVDALRRISLERSGWLMVERRPADAPDGFTPWSIPPDRLALMRRLKTALDPDGTFPDVLP